MGRKDSMALLPSTVNVPGGTTMESRPGEALLAHVGRRLGAQTKAGRIFGKPVREDGVTVVPVARARWGFGAGGGKSGRADTGVGGGGGAIVTPVGYLVIRDGNAEFRPIRGMVRQVAGAAVAGAAVAALGFWLGSRRR